MRYIILPLELNTEQREIYWLLYSRMDFDTFEVKYTLDQLANDSNEKLCITKKKASLIIKEFISKGYLNVLKKGSKGNPTIYEVVKIDKIGKHKSNLKETQRELKGNIRETNKPSDTNSYQDFEKHKGNLKETQRELKGNTKVTPTNDKDKDKDNIYIEIQEIRKYYKGTKSKSVADKKLPKLIKQYTKEQLIRAIERYNKFVMDQRKTGFQLQFKNEGTFWNGGYVDYLDENYSDNQTTNYSNDVKKTNIYDFNASPF